MKKKYTNARDILPESLIREIQQHIRGQHIYIPQLERGTWGSASGIREELDQRNAEIFRKFQEGCRMSQLAEMYNLSEERIRGIIYERDAK